MRIAGRMFFVGWIVLAAVLPGCGWLKGGWFWQKEVPVTPPTRSAPAVSASQADTTRPANPQAEDNSQQRDQTPRQAKVEEPTPLVSLVDDAGSTSQPATKPASESQPSAATKPAPHGQDASQPVVVAGSMLQVNDRFITVDRVLRSVHPELSTLPGAPKMSEAAFRRRAGAIIDKEIRDEVTRSLVFAEAKRRLPERHREQVDAEVEQFRQDMIAHAGGSMTKLRRELSREGTTLKSVLEDHRRRLLIRLYLQAKFMPAISINRRMLWNYYRRHRGEFTTAKQVQMQIIAAPFHAFLPKGRPAGRKERLTARGEARKLINRAMAVVRGGEDFGKVARERSRGLKARRGGVWPMMPAGSFREEKVEQAAFALTAGQVSGIIETETGFYIVKALQVEPKKVRSFEEAQERIDEILRQKQYLKLVNAYFRRLTEGATIIQPREFRRLVLDRAVEKYRRPQ